MPMSPSPEPPEMQEDAQPSQTFRRYDRALTPDVMDSFFMNLFFNNYDKWRTNTRTLLEIISKRAGADRLTSMIENHDQDFTPEQIKAFLHYFYKDPQFKTKFLEKTMEYLKKNETYLDDGATDMSFKFALSEYHDAVEQNIIIIPEGVDEAEYAVYTKAFMIQKAAEYRGKLEVMPQELPEAFRESTEEIFKSKYEIYKRQIDWAFFNPNLRRKYELNKIFLLFDVFTIVRNPDGSINFEALKDNMFIFNLLIDDRYIPYFFIKIILKCIEDDPSYLGKQHNTVVDYIMKKISEGTIDIGVMESKLSYAQFKYIIGKAYSYITNEKFKKDDMTILAWLINNEQFKVYLRSLPSDSDILLANAISIFFDDREKKYTVEDVDFRISQSLEEKLGNINASNIKTFEIIAKTLDIYHTLDRYHLLSDIHKIRLRQKFIENIAKLLYYEQLIRNENAEKGEKVYVLQKADKVKEFKSILSKDEIDLVDKLIASFVTFRRHIDNNNQLILQLAQLNELIKNKSPALGNSEIEQIVNFLATHWIAFFDKEDEIKKSNDYIQEFFSTDILIPLNKIQEIAEKMRRITSHGKTLVASSGSKTLVASSGSKTLVASSGKTPASSGKTPASSGKTPARSGKTAFGAPSTSGRNIPVKSATERALDTRRALETVEEDDDDKQKRENRKRRNKMAKQGSSASSASSSSSIGGGRKPVKCTKTGVKKEILGKERCIYKKPNDRKEYVKYKGDFVTVKEFKEIHKKKTAEKSKKKNAKKADDKKKNAKKADDKKKKSANARKRIKIGGGKKQGRNKKLQ